MQLRILVFTVALGCNGVPADTGADATMQVHGARFVRGPMPASPASGPAVLAITLVNGNIWPTLDDFAIAGDLAPSATAAAIGLQGDVGYWIIPAGVPSYETPNDPTFAATAGFSSAILPQPYALAVSAVDAAGNFGPSSTAPLTGETDPLNPPAQGGLVVTLRWDTEANLSLHVVDPTGNEIYWGHPSSAPAPPAAQVDGGSYGYIDYDSNANCVIDGLRREDAIWPGTDAGVSSVPAGTYTVRVDTPSLCGQAEANWTVQVVLEGATVAEASGIALPADTIGSHGAGSGVLAVQFTAR